MNDFFKSILRTPAALSFDALMNTSFKPGNCRNIINQFEDPSVRMIARAEYCYFSGKAEEAAQITEGYLSHENLAIRLSVAVTTPTCLKINQKALP